MEASWYLPEALINENNNPPSHINPKQDKKPTSQTNLIGERGFQGSWEEQEGEYVISIVVPKGSNNKNKCNW